MPTRPGDKRPPLVVAMQLATQITSGSIMMVLPVVLGYWADRKWGTEPWLLILGAAGGLVIGMRHIMRLASTKQKKKPR